MRGEHLRDGHHAAGWMGSPPHARGAHPEPLVHNDGPGITPACAGSTTTLPTRSGGDRDHPRMRGEHRCVPISSGCTRGSPPHARGARQAGRRLSPAPRITPACAGSTRSRSRCSPRRWDHPRMRGEHLIHSTNVPLRRGSPPHARGAPSLSLRTEMMSGITPACAGSTGRDVDAAIGAWDHPRMRGEHDVLDAEAIPDQGSPPHARGARVPLGDRQLRPGITPACAGSTTGSSGSTGSSGDHPRMRGEHSL